MLRNARGCTLAEVAVATGILTTVSVGVAQMFVLAAARNLASRQLVAATALATKKMEELRALGFSTDSVAAALDPSPANALDEDTPGFVDYLDAQGTPVEARQAVFIRRWSIAPAGIAGDALVITVLATVAAHERTRPRFGRRVRLPEDAVLVAARAKRTP